ncbi:MULTISPECIES: alpha-L-rhamnosidase [Cohnella]|uniref:alpha-L-rhamnosidase n=1 Tax=Cohnella TaxID=329857 RepID=UPI0009BB61FB|nr:MULTISPECIES: alpha-L-rhamnosidase [Cohnella]MBN2980760.1 family 78 glycoside hydrolase catalytic domain [Cohnella algarum]
MRAWQAKWIADPEFAALQPISLLHKEQEAGPSFAHPEQLRNRHMLVRKTFSLAAAPARAVLRISADDYYKLYVNGRFVGQGPAQGYPFHYNYNEWDVGSYLAAGDNVIAVHVYYQGIVNRAYNSGDLRQGTIAELHADEELLLATDRTWKFRIAGHYGGGDGETVGYETQFLENIDQRLAVPGWQEAGFPDDDWQEPAERPDADYAFAPQPVPAVCVYRVAPERVVRLAEGRYLLDFGRELTGQFEMEARGRPGERIEVRYGEELADDGSSVRYELRCNCRYREIWTLSGREDKFEPFEYKAFRYVELDGPDEALRPDSFAAVVRHYPLDESACRLETDDPLLRRIWDICLRGVQLCAQENYVDCPSREKGQYLGDNTVMGHTHMYIGGDMRLFKKAIRDFALSAAVCPGLLAVAPGHFMQEIADFSLQWPMQLLLYYRHSGDEAFLLEMLPVAEGVLDYFRKYARPDGLLENVKEKWNLVDWPDNLRDGYDFPLTRPVGDGCHNVVNAFYIGCVQTVQEIRDFLGVPCEDELPKLKRAFVDAFYRGSAGLFADSDVSGHSSLHANVLPLLFGIAPPESVRPIVALIREKRLSCGVYMSYFVLKALAACGETDLIYELIMCEDERSWANMVREGATSCFEAWGKEQKWNTSLCHGWASAPIPVLIEDIIGLKPAAPGWANVDFRPRIPAAMRDFELEFRTVRGPVRVRYRQGKLQLETP